MTWRNPFRAGKEARADLAAAQETKETVKAHHDEALDRLKSAEAMAEKLNDMDRRNHYSESLTKAFQPRQGRLA